MPRLNLFLLTFFFFPNSLLNAQEIELAPKAIESEDTYTEKIYHARSGDLWGFRGFSSDKWYVSPIYESLELTYSSFIVAAKNKKYGVIDSVGNTIIPFEFDEIAKPHPRILTVKQRKNRSEHCFNWFLAQKGGVWGGIDSSGHTVLPFQWKRAYWVNDTIVLYTRDNELHLAGPAGRVYLHEKPENWSWANSNNFKQKLLLSITKKGKTGIINHEGKVIVDLKFAKLNWAHDNFICMEAADGQLALYNEKGQELLPLQNADMRFLGSNLAWVVKDRQLGQTGVMDGNGAIVLPFEYAECQLIREHDGFLASPFLQTRHLKSDLYSLHHLDGKPLTPALFKGFRWFDETPELLSAQLADDSWRLLNLEGQPITPTVFTAITPSGKILIGTNNTGMEAFFSLDGVQITDFKYQTAKGFSNPWLAEDFARRLKLDDSLQLIGEASRKGVPQAFIDQKGGEHFLGN